MADDMRLRITPRLAAGLALHAGIVGVLVAMATGLAPDRLAAVARLPRGAP